MGPFPRKKPSQETGIPVCILVLKKCKKPDDVLFINASEHYEKGKRQNQLNPGHIDKIIQTYKKRPKKPIDRYVSTAEPEPVIDLKETHKAIVSADKDIRKMTAKHNEFLKELGLALLPLESGQMPLKKLAAKKRK